MDTESEKCLDHHNYAAVAERINNDNPIDDRKPNERLSDAIGLLNEARVWTRTNPDFAEDLIDAALRNLVAIQRGE